MNRTTCISILLLLGLGLCSPCLAQEDLLTHDVDQKQPKEGLLIGITAGIMNDVHEESKACHVIHGLPACYPDFTKASSDNGALFGITGEYWLNDIAGIYSSLSFTSHRTYKTESFSVDDPTREINFLVGKAWDYHSMMIALGTSFSIVDAGPGRLRGHVGIGLGLFTQLYTMNDVQVEMSTISQQVDGASKQNTEISKSADEKPTEETSRSRVSMGWRLSYDYPLLDRIYIQPALNFDYGLTTVIPDSEWRIHYLTAQLGVMMAL